MKRDRVPVLIGIVLGLAISGYALVYAPMRRNYLQCGKVTLCPALQKDAHSSASRLSRQAGGMK